MYGKDKPARNANAAGSNSAPGLRQRAEAAFQDKAAKRPARIESLSPEAVQQALHDLEVHQIELELQNEELRRTLAELETTRARFFDFYDMAPLGYCTLSAQGQILQANLRTASLLGVPRKKLIGQRFTHFVQPDLQDIYFQMQRRMLASGEIESCELSLCTGSGQSFWIVLQGMAATDEDGSQQVRLVLIDNRQQRQTREQLHLQALVLDQIQDQVTITDLSGVVTYLNRSGRERHDSSGIGYMGRNVLDYGDNAKADATQREITEATLNQGGWQGNVINLQADGSARNYDLRTTLVKNAAGTAIAMVGISTDITDKLKLEQELHAREASQRAMLDNFPFVVWLKDADGRYLAVNKTLAETHGWPSPQSLVGKRFADVVDPVTAAKALAQEQVVLATGSSQLMEIQMPIKGELRWFETYKAPIFIGNEIVGTVGYSQDITERKQIEIELEEARNEAIKANMAKSHFLAAASHDLRQPIFALSLFFSSLKNRVPPQHGELIDKIESCIESLSEMLSDLLDVSKLEAGIIHPNITNFSVDDMLHKLLSTHGARAYSAGLRLRLRDSGLVGHSDPILLGRIVGNFLDNAIGHTRKGGVLIACRRHSGRHWIEIWDTGIGIAPDKLGIIFEAFRRLDEAARIRGSGLGLAIVEKSAELLGLQIRVSSRPGRGSMFAIELPLGVSAAPALQARKQSPMRRLRIALVEDDDRVRDALLQVLEDAGYEPIAAASGKALIEALAGRRPDILVSDYRLADTETGYDVIETSRQIFGENLPALLITGDTNPALIRSMTGRGIRVLYKPLQLDALKAAIRDAVDSKP